MAGREGLPHAGGIVTQAYVAGAAAGLAELGSPKAARAKLERLPAPLRAFAEQIPVAGTPEDVAPGLRALVAAGFQYLICMVSTSDPETLHLLAQQVVPAVVGGKQCPS